MHPLPFETVKSLQRERWRQAEEFRLARRARRSRRRERSSRPLAVEAPAVVLPFRPRPEPAPEAATPTWTNPPDAA